MELQEQPREQEPIKQVRPKPNILKILIPVLSLVLILSLAVVVYLLFQDKFITKQASVTENTTPTVTSAPTPSIAPMTIFTDTYEFGTKIAQVFGQIQAKHKGNIFPSDALPVWWVSNDNFNIITRDAKGLSYKDYSCGDSTSEEKFRDIATDLSQDIQIVMREHSFTKNEKNSSTSITDDRFYDYIQAYEKDKTKCTLKAVPDCSRGLDEPEMYYQFDFACTESFDNSYQEQAPYLKGLNITQGIVQVSKRVGDYAFLHVNYRRTGHYVIAQRINGVWTRIIHGQDVPPCDLMEQHNVPQEVYGECYTPAKN